MLVRKIFIVCSFVIGFILSCIHPVMATDGNGEIQINVDTPTAFSGSLQVELLSEDIRYTYPLNSANMYTLYDQINPGIYEVTVSLDEESNENFTITNKHTLIVIKEKEITSFTIRVLTHEEEEKIEKEQQQQASTAQKEENEDALLQNLLDLGLELIYSLGLIAIFYFVGKPLFNKYHE